MDPTQQQNPQSIGESSITPQMQQQVTSDVVSPQGKQQLFQHLASATQQKGLLDFIFKGIADKVGAEFTSRIKSPQTVVQKIAQKRLQGRDYDIQDINDAYGGRFIVNSKNEIGEIKKLMEKADALGIIKINKSETVTNDTYHAYHIDFETPQGTHGEAQIMNGNQELEAVANHGLRSVFGEKPPDRVQALRDKQADIAGGLKNDDAHLKAQAIQALAKQNNNQPLDPRAIASILKP